MFDFLYDTLQSLAGFISRNFMRVLAYPFNPGERLFVLYLTTSLVMAIVVWRYVARRQPRPDAIPVSLREFLFPSSIWRTASAWLDVRYFFFHQILRVFLYSELYADGVRLDFQDSRRILRYHGGFQSRWRAAIRMAGGNWLRLRLGRIA